ncbi:MAG TPA: DUF4124 domain-containing protein [Steroidobacteraceae bacterium]|nr:DUF4124 domain-containing protein [Steroidobacteraceae bacterium]HRX87946.1 DUF4124 domain-containing protein [Steroidobacteraceae bacterium]
MRALILAILASALFSALPAAWAQSSTENAKRTYKWTDERGVVHYGDAVPPQYATREQRVLNQQGVEVARTAAQKSAEEQALEAQQQRELARRKQHDMFLLSTYQTVEDLQKDRDVRLDALQGQVLAAEAFIANLEARLGTLRERAAVFRPYNDSPNARQMPDSLAEDIVRLLGEIRTQRTALEVKNGEKQALREQFQIDMARYKELKKPLVDRATAQR